MTDQEADQIDSCDTNASVEDPNCENPESPAQSPAKPSRLRRRLIIVGIVLLICGIVAVGEYRFPTGDASGSALSGLAPAQVAEQTPQQPPYRIASYNIHSGKGADGKRDIQRTADTLKDFDLVGLQEVRDIILDGKADQAAQLGKSLSMQWLFAPSVSRWGTPVHGNGLLSKFKAVQWQRTALPSRSSSATRNLLHVQLDIQGKPVHVLVTHLTMTGDRKAQLEQIFSVFLKLPAPVILMGDLNTMADDPMIKRVRDRPDVIDVRTYMTKADQHRIRVDWILMRGIDVLKAGVAKSAASDHHLVWTEIRIAPVPKPKPNQSLPETKPEK